MATRELIKSIFFDEIINEAKTGEVKIKIDDETFTFNVGFNSCIGGVLESGNFGDSKPILMINNEEQILNFLEQYFNECDKHPNIYSNCTLEERIKLYLTLMWSNATYEDFANPCVFIARRRDFYKNKLLDSKTFEYASNVEILEDSKIIVHDEMQDIRQETPYLFSVTIEKDSDFYTLPHISYGIYNDECYIYAIQNDKKDELTSFEKKIKRKLYKVNSGVLDTETDEYKGYVEGTDDYHPENISEVSPAAILSMIIFLDTLNKQGIEKIKVVSLLPVRYNSKELAFSKKYEFKLKHGNLSDTELKKLLLEYKRESLRIQQNLTEKMIRNFRRIEFHFDNCSITSYPMEFDEYLHMNVREFKYSNNDFINEVLGLTKLDISK